MSHFSPLQRTAFCLALCSIVTLGRINQVHAQCSTSNIDPIINIDFGSGTGGRYSNQTPADFGFTTTYNTRFGGDANATEDGEYSIVNAIEANWLVWHWDAEDHTPGDVGGYMLQVNATDQANNEEFFRTTVDGLCIGVDYIFSAWIANIYDNNGVAGNMVDPTIQANTPFTVPDVEFRILDDNNVEIANHETGNIPVNLTTMTWTEHLLTFTATSNEVTLVLRNNNDGGWGNDLALDDITFTPCLPDYDVGSQIEVCTGDNQTLTASATSLPFPSPVYQWQRLVGGTWTDIGGATSQDYDITNVEMTDAGWYRAIIASAGNLNSEYCRAVDSVELVVEQGVEPGQIATDQALCSGEIPAAFTNVYSASFGDGNYTYTWEMSTDLTTWSPIAGTNSTTYAHMTGITQETYFRRVVASGLCPDRSSDTITISMNSPVDPVTTDVESCQFLEVPRPMATGPNLLWYTAASGGTGVSTYPTIDSTTAGSTTLYVSASLSGCESGRFPVTATIIEKPVLDVPVDSICEGETTTLTASSSAGSPAFTYSWEPEPSLSTTTGASTDASPTSTTTYIVYVEDDEGCLDTAEVQVVVHELPELSIPDGGICPAETTNYTGSLTTLAGPGTYSWTPVEGLNISNGVNILGNPNTTTSYTATYTDENGCQDTANFDIEVYSKPEVTVTDESSCPGDTAFFTASIINASGNVSYLWSPATNLNSSSSATPFSTAAITTPYTIIVTDENGCGDTTTASHIIHSSLTVSVNEGAICPAGSITLDAQVTGATGAITYSWTPTLGLNVDDQASVIASPSTTTTYSVFASDGNGCGGAATATVTIHEKPELNIENAESCPGIPVSVNSSVTSTASTLTYTWAPLHGLDIQDGPAITATLQTTTTFDVYVTDENTCGDTAQLTVTVNPKPILSIPNISSCFPASQVFASSVSDATGNVQYEWDNTSLLSASNTASPTSSATSTTLYTVMIEDEKGCKDTAQTTHTVYEKPEITVPDGSICAGESLLLSSQTNSSSTVLNFDWSPAGTLSAPNTPNVTASPVSKTTYTVIVTDENACSDTAVSEVLVHELPELSIGNIAYCEGESGQEAATLISNATSVSYDWSPVTGLSIADGPIVTATPSATTSYEVVVTDSEQCRDTATFEVVVHDRPEANGVDAETCEEIPANLSVNVVGGTGNISYSWSPNTALNNIHSQNVTSSNSESIEYTIEVEDENGCKDNATAFFKVNPKPEATVPGSDVCSGTPATLTAEVSSGTGPFTYNWTPGTGLSGTSSASVTASPASTTTYTLFVADAANCLDTAEVTVGITNTPVAQQNQGDGVLCPGETMSLTAFDDPAQNYSFTWFFGGSPGTLSQISTGNGFTAAEEGYYAVEVRNNGGCPELSETIYLDVENVTVSVSASEETIYFDESVRVSAQGSDDVISYFWQTSVGGFNTQVITASPSEEALFEVIASGQRCTATAGLFVKVLPEIIVPNGFSPNGDGKNDAWFIKGIEDYPTAEVYVYNRWGTPVIKFQNGYPTPWTGVQDNGKELPIATYYYVIEARDRRNQTFNGSVTILK